MSNIRLRLQFADDQKYWLYVDLEKIKTIQDVIDDINQKYSIDCDKLLLDDAQLFSKETVKILQDKDLIHVCLKPEKKKKRTHAEPDGLTETQVEETPPEPKKKKKDREKSKDQECEILASRVSQIELVPEAPLPAKHKREKKIDEEASLECKVKAPEPQVVSELDSSNLDPTDEVEAKRKRRRRRRKSHHKSITEIDTNAQVVDVFQNYVPVEPKERLHVRFDDTSTLDTELESTQDEMLTNGRGILKTNKPDGFEKANPLCLGEVKVKGYKTLDKHVAFKTPSAASSPIVPQLGALLSLRSAVFSRNSNENTVTPSYNSVPPPPAFVSSQVVSASPTIPVLKEPVKLDPTTFPIITGPPRVHDVIAFKVLELSENYNPEVSDYMQGRVSHIHPNGDITVDLLDPRIKRHARGKFELLEDEEEDEVAIEVEPQEEYESTVTYNWREMIEPRLIFP